MQKPNVPGFLYLLIFTAIVLVTIIVVASLKIINEISTSSFKNNTFSLLIISKDSKLIYVDREGKSALFLALGNIEKYVKGKNTLEATFALGVPVNGIIYDAKPPQNLEGFINSSYESRLIFGGDVKLKNLNRYDVFKLNNSVKNANKDNREEIRVNLFNQESMEKINEYFIDSKIRNSRQTIQIDNGTGINGLGNLLAIILNMQGYNVIAVRTARSMPSSHISYRDEPGIVVNSLKGLTSFELKEGGVSPASDITIFLGDDVSSMLTP